MSHFETLATHNHRANPFETINVQQSCRTSEQSERPPRYWSGGSGKETREIWIRQCRYEQPIPNAVVNLDATPHEVGFIGQGALQKRISNNCHQSHKRDMF